MSTTIDELGWIFAFFALHLIVPGPSMLYICASAGRGELRRALAFVVGTSIGTALWAGFAVFGAWRLAADAPILLGVVKVLIALALLAFGGRAILAACAPLDPEKAGADDAPVAASLHGILLTLGSVNELVFWSAILTLGAGSLAGPDREVDAVFAISLILGVVLIAFVVEAALACLATAGGIGRIIRRLRRPLEAALGLAFCGTGAALLNLV
jgi:threonine/homoserine/homoserine lactone efflux protein